MEKCGVQGIRATRSREAGGSPMPTGQEQRGNDVDAEGEELKQGSRTEGTEC